MAAWVAAGSDHEVALRDGKITCRTRTGKVLKALPKAVQQSDAVAGLRQLVEWLDRHDTTCRREVEQWLVRSLPVPTAVVVAVWPDQSWRSALRDVVVAPVDAAGGWQLDRAGFLRDVSATSQPGVGKLGVVNLDGESVWLDATRVVLPHPVLLSELDELREFAADLGVAQGVLQLFREIWRKPDQDRDQATAVAAYSGGHFAQLRQLTGRAAALGYAVRGGYVTARLWDRGRVVDACVWAGSGEPMQETATGELVFLDSAGAPVALAGIGPVAWSEGMRMAAALYAGRAVATEDT